mmetsp:Transcript_62343/g.171387  ORF Transcript_62343/g.171387 Transcript_62343/m.171387 type:complete len:519 (+) Transcript_62343:110-1666(+)
MRSSTILSGLALNVFGATANTIDTLWPIPASISDAVTTAVPMESDVAITVKGGDESARLNAAIARYQTLIEGTAEAGAGIATVELAVASDDESLTSSTDYSYALSVSGEGGDATIAISCQSSYGCMYGLETLAQLAESDGTVPSPLTIEDAPQYSHRGLMLDTGRRFIPMDSIKQNLDAMAATKMNVLHLHAADFCRFSIESKVFPELTANLTGVKGGFYTQDDVAEMVTYAADRGIRVYPEFDLPGHSLWADPLKERGLEFCADGENEVMKDTEAGRELLVQLFEEMAGLFDDELFSMGMDEVVNAGDCTLDDHKQLEESLIAFVDTQLGLHPNGWEEYLFSTNAAEASDRSVVTAWSAYRAADVVDAGYEAIESHNSFFYLNNFPTFIDSWADISENVTNLTKLRGGEVSMWTDNYCYITQCGAFGTGSPVGAPLFPPEADTEFAASLAGMVWPGASVGAGAFYNYDAELTEDELNARINASADRFAARGIDVCPVSTDGGCSCDELSRCGTPYLQ